MRHTSILVILIFLTSLNSFGQNAIENKDEMTIEKWNEESKTDIRLLPKYGNVKKSEKQLKADEEFIETILKQHNTRENGSNELIKLGFKYMYKNNLRTAMFRFNQAFLLHPENSDIYWGYGAIYMTLGDFEKAKEQYTEGLKLNPNNSHLLTDYATYFLTQYLFQLEVSEKDALKNLNEAILNLNKSYKIDTKDQNTLFKLSACYFYNNDCKNAKKYYDECITLGGDPITVEYTEALNDQCKK